MCSCTVDLRHKDPPAPSEASKSARGLNPRALAFAGGSQTSSVQCSSGDSSPTSGHCSSPSTGGGGSPHVAPAFDAGVVQGAAQAEVMTPQGGLESLPSFTSQPSTGFAAAQVQ